MVMDVLAFNYNVKCIYVFLQYVTMIKKQYLKLDLSIKKGYTMENDHVL